MDNSVPFIASEEVRKNITRSVLLIGIIVALIVLASYYIGVQLNSPEAGFGIAVIVTLIVIPIQILIGKYAILAMSKGRKPDMNNLAERRAAHIVDGLAVSAGLRKTPELYIIPTRVPNAFASGLTEDSAFIGVTEGLLNMMDDQQLKGVIAHEFGHIIHRDILLNQLVVSLISVLLILAIVIERLGFAAAINGGGRRRNNNNNNGGGIILLILLAVLVRPLASIIGSLLQLGISRQREYAADAAAVRLCAYNEGLASALEKLDDRHPYTEEEAKSLGGREMACMYINFPGGELFSTHPPIAKRVQKLRNMY